MAETKVDRKPQAIRCMSDSKQRQNYYNESRVLAFYWLFLRIEYESHAKLRTIAVHFTRTECQMNDDRC